MNLPELQTKWNDNAETYSRKEVGEVQDFIKGILSCPELFNLKNTIEAKKQPNTYAPEVKSSNGKVDFLVYITKDVIIPCEVKHRGTISPGDSQLKRYQLDYSKQYGILTDGYEWRFYRSSSYRVFTLDDIFANPKDFLTFWQNYLKAENYYLDVFAPEGQGVLFDEALDLNNAENRSVFFKDTTKIISQFRTKIKIKDDKTAVETAYAYLIQFILYKVLVDNRFQKFENEYKLFRQQIIEAIRSKNLYYLIVSKVRDISDYISKNIYKPFAKEQQAISEKLIADLKRELEIDDIAAWLDIIAFVNKYDFSNLQNEIFGFVYENYLKDLYGENKGQYFTQPEIAVLMLDELGYNEELIKSNPDKISIIDPACGAGTFLYTAAHRIKNALDTRSTEKQAGQIKELIDKNVFGLDLTEFSLYLAEMSILMGLLPLIVNDKFEQPIANKLKLFKTRDSISEFLDTGITAQEKPVDLLTHLQETALDYQSFMRDDKNLEEMLLSMQGSRDERLRFDYVIANPPYISYKDCSIQKIDFMQKIKEHRLKMNNVYGVNLHSIPSNQKKYAPTPNIFAFFIALSFGLLKDNGKVCFIVPQTTLIAEALDVVRFYLAGSTTIEKLITFEGNLFIGRGLNSKKEVPTSSLIFIASKKAPRANHSVQIVNYNQYTEKQKGDFALYLNSRNKNKRVVPQCELLERVGNWNWIKHNELERQFCEQYAAQCDDMAHYHDHTLAVKQFGTPFYFDRGLKYPKTSVREAAENETEGLFIPQKNKRCFTLNASDKCIDTALLDFPFGSQGLKVYLQKYKIVWGYMNYDRFRFSSDPIMIDYNNVLISSDNKSEMLYIFALLNSAVSKKIFHLFLYLPNEQDLTIGIKFIKNYVRIPKITAKNQKLKDRIVVKTEELLALENVVLKDIVDFGRLSVQKFDSINVSGNNLLLHNGKEFKLPIKEQLVHKVIAEKYLSGKMFSQIEIKLSELKSLPAVDFDKQAETKKEIDDLVFALYFNVPVKDVVKHEFYGYINT